MNDRYDIDKINGYFLKSAAGTGVCYDQTGITYPPHRCEPDWYKEIHGISKEAKKILVAGGFKNHRGGYDLEKMFRAAGAGQIGWEEQNGWSNQPYVLVCQYMEDAWTGERLTGVKDGEIVDVTDDKWSEVFYHLGLIVRPKDW